MENQIKPNILFILSDQHNAKLIHAKGDPNVVTPNFDKLISKGVSFDTAITQNAICTPSRVSFLSGQYCHNHGYYGLEGDNPKGLPTFLGHFRENGYRTAAVGKMHCPMYWVEDDCDLFIETRGCSIEGNPKYLNHLKSNNIENDNGLTEFGDKGRQALDARASKNSYEESEEAYIVSEAIQFMQESKAENKPFIAHLSFPKPHQCYIPAKEFWDLYDEKDLVLPPNTDYDMKDKAPSMKETAQGYRKGEWTLFEPKTFEAGRLRKLHGYLGCVSQVDRGVGDIMEWLEKNDMVENTIVIYSSDHGDYACEHDIMEKAPGICSDAITRVPSIWYWGSKFTGRAVKEIIESVDVANTICSLAGLDAMETVDGKDISSLLFGENTKIHNIGVTENVWSKSIRKGKYRFVFYVKDMFPEEYPNGFGELYDMETDPYELENLFFKEEHQGLIKEFKEDLLNWIIKTTRPKTMLGVKQRSTKQNEYRYRHYTNKDGKFNPNLLITAPKTRL